MNQAAHESRVGFVVLPAGTINNFVLIHRGIDVLRLSDDSQHDAFALKKLLFLALHGIPGLRRQRFEILVKAAPAHIENPVAEAKILLHHKAACL